jgi:hypothetical protein
MSSALRMSRQNRGAALADLGVVLAELQDSLLHLLRADSLRDEVLEAVTDHVPHLVEPERRLPEFLAHLVQAFGDGLVRIDQRAVEVEDDAANQGCPLGPRGC